MIYCCVFFFTTVHDFHVLFSACVIYFTQLSRTMYLSVIDPPNCRVQCVLTDTLHGAVYTTTYPGHCSAVFLVFSCFFFCFPCLACVSTCFALSVIFVLPNTVRLQSSYMMSASTLLMLVSTLLMFDLTTYHLYICLTCSVPSSIHETTRVPC
jgi:hypothetical protein